MKNFSPSPQEIFKSIWRNRYLLKVLIMREVLGRYKGSIFGLLWSFLNPVFMLLVYTFVFSVIFKARWGGGSDSKIEFALILFAGLIIFNLFAECLSRSSGLIIANANYVKKVVFPLEILPIVFLGSALFHALISYGVWLIAYMIFYGLPHPTVLMMPLVFIPLIFFILGITWAFSWLGVYFRDMNQLVGLIITVLMFLSPIFYPIKSLPEDIQIFAKLNPLAQIIEQSREILFWGKIPNLAGYVICLIGSLLIFFMGFMSFQRARKGFADVI